MAKQKGKGFTLEGYNDKPKPCRKRGCDGRVRPTYNANVGRCDKCGTNTPWRFYN